MERYKKNQPHRNYIYVIEKKVGSRWEVPWDVSAFESYDVAKQITRDFEKYSKHPDKYRIIMYISIKPHDE